MIGGELIQDARSTNCMVAVELSNNHQSGKERTKLPTVNPSATQRDDSGLTRRQSTAPINGENTIRLNQGNDVTKIYSTGET